jgi:hypothetical protein
MTFAGVLDVADRDLNKFQQSPQEDELIAS